MFGADIDSLWKWHSATVNVSLSNLGYKHIFELRTDSEQRPDIQSPFLNITVFDEANATPGYIFMAPYQTAQQSVYMYDNRGNLVWSGFGPTGAGPSHNFHVCQINGTDHLCYETGYQVRNPESIHPLSFALYLRHLS
jgi:hypothetical protein